MRCIQLYAMLQQNDFLLVCFTVHQGVVGTYGRNDMVFVSRDNPAVSCSLQHLHACDGLAAFQRKMCVADSDADSHSCAQRIVSTKLYGTALNVHLTSRLLLMWCWMHLLQW